MTSDIENYNSLYINDSNICFKTHIIERFFFNNF